MSKETLQQDVTVYDISQDEFVPVSETHYTVKIRKFLTPNTSTSLFDEIMRLDHSVAKLEASMIRLEQTIAKSVDSSRAVHSGRRVA